MEMDVGNLKLSLDSESSYGKFSFPKRRELNSDSGLGYYGFSPPSYPSTAWSSTNAKDTSLVPPELPRTHK